MALYSAYGLRQVSTILAPNNQYRVIVELEPEYQRDANAISCCISAPNNRPARSHQRYRKTIEQLGVPCP